MLSLACFSAANPLIVQQSSLLKSSKSKTTTRTRNNNRYCLSYTQSNSTSTRCFHYPITDAHVYDESLDSDWENAQALPRHLTDYTLLASWLQSCSRLGDVKRVHAVVLKCLANSVTFVFNNLICAYLKDGKLEEARKVFDGMPERNVITWTAMIDGYCNFDLEDEALRLFGECIENGVVLNGKTFVCVLNLCSKRADYELGRQVHACIVKGNWRNLIVDSALVYFYAQCGDLDCGFCLFDRMVERDVICWSTMIMACSQHGRGEKAFEMFLQMLYKGFSPNKYTVCGVLKACAEEKALKFGRQLHGAAVKMLLEDDVFVGTCLVDMYGKCGEIIDARKVFNRMRKRNTVTWTSMIAGYARKGLGDEALGLFRVMKQRRVISNDLTIVSILRSCGSIGALLTGREVHALTLKSGTQSNEYIGNALVWFYCKCGESHTASKVLRRMPLRDVVSWTALISGHACLGHDIEALKFLKEMMEEGVEPNSFTYSSALKACANVEAVLHGKSIHSFANKAPASCNVFVGSALIYMYAKCGHLSEAIQVFDSMADRNLVTWKIMIMGYAKNGRCGEALKLMYRMQAEGIEVDDYVFATVVGICGDVNRDAGRSSSEYCLLSS